MFVLYHVSCPVNYAVISYNYETRFVYTKTFQLRRKNSNMYESLFVVIQFEPPDKTALTKYNDQHIIGFFL